MLSFLGIGTQKAGTTWLYELLTLHPAVDFPHGKEIHFWDRRQERAAEDWLGLFDDESPDRFEGEITPAYAMLDNATIEEIYRCRPHLRVFLSVRNPIERAWSGAMMALHRAELKEQEASDAWFIDHFRSRGSRGRGDYAGCLERWSKVFPDEQIEIVFFDDIVCRPRAVLADLARHIGIDVDFYAGLEDDELGRRANSGQGVPIRPSLLPVLHELYDSAIDDFSRKVDRDLGAWKFAPEER